jgi:chromosome segregation ATPase
MPDWSTIVPLAIALLTGGGLSTLIRARSQNRVDERAQLTTEQQSFRQSMAEQIAGLRVQLADGAKHNDGLEQELRGQGKELAALATKNDYQERQLREQAQQIADLRTQNATQAAQIAALTEEKAGVTQRLQAEVLKSDFLTRENNELRHEITRLREKPPMRGDTTNGHD